MIEKYRGSDEAMTALLYMIDYMKQRNRLTEADRWYQMAEEHYDDVAYTSRGTITEAKALFYKAELKRRAGEHTRAVDILLRVYRKFPASEPGHRALLGAADVYRNELNNPSAADSLINVLRLQLSNVDSTVENPDLLAD